MAGEGFPLVDVSTPDDTSTGARKRAVVVVWADLEVITVYGNPLGPRHSDHIGDEFGTKKPACVRAQPAVPIHLLNS